MSEFEEYWNDGFNSYDDAKDAAKDAWEEQQKGIDNVLKVIEWHLEDCACFHPMSNYQLGWFEAMSLIKEELIKCNEKQHSEY